MAGVSSTCTAKFIVLMRTTLSDSTSSVPPVAPSSCVRAGVRACTRVQVRAGTCRYAGMYLPSIGMAGMRWGCAGLPFIVPLSLIALSRYAGPCPSSWVSVGAAARPGVVVSVKVTNLTVLSDSQRRQTRPAGHDLLSYSPDLNKPFRINKLHRLKFRRYTLIAWRPGLNPRIEQGA